jgi:hypothetical protein
MRVRFGQAKAAGWAWSGRILRPERPPPGYTGNTVLTEWLTLNCVGPWASKHSRRWLVVLFAEEADAVRAYETFMPQGMWV